MGKIKCEQIAQLLGNSFNEMTGRVYSQEGLCPGIRTFCGGGQEVKIAEPIMKKAQRKDIKIEIKYCEYCGKKLERKRYNGRLEDFSIYQKRKYCDMKCMAEAFKKAEHSGTSWSIEHKIARELKGKGVCEICGSGKNVDVHHKDGNWHNNDINNLQNLCRSCHTKIHRGGDEMETNYRVRKLTPKECFR